MIGGRVQHTYHTLRLTPPSMSGQSGQVHDGPSIMQHSPPVLMGAPHIIATHNRPAWRGWACAPSSHAVCEKTLRTAASARSPRRWRCDFRHPHCYLHRPCTCHHPRRALACARHVQTKQATKRDRAVVFCLFDQSAREWHGHPTGLLPPPQPHPQPHPQLQLRLRHYQPQPQAQHWRPRQHPHHPHAAARMGKLRRQMRGEGVRKSCWPVAPVVVVCPDCWTVHAAGYHPEARWWRSDGGACGAQPWTTCSTCVPVLRHRQQQW